MSPTLTPAQVARAAAYNAGHERLHHFTRLAGLSPTASWTDVSINVAAFQAAAGLPVDGMAGPVTLRALFAAEGHTAPALPFVMPRTPAGLEAFVGHRVAFYPHPITEKRGDAARLEPCAELERALAVYPFRVRGGIDHVTLHRKIGAAFAAAYDFAVVTSGHVPADVQGTVCRRKNWDPTATPSTHSPGFAIDCDPTSNGRGDVTPSLPPRFFSAMRACGVINGRDFRSTDPMHFQVVHDSAIDDLPVIPR